MRVPATRKTSNPTVGDNFMSGYWTDQLAAHWGIAVKLKPLEGEYDLYFSP